MFRALFLKGYYLDSLQTFSLDVVWPEKWSLEK